MQDGRAPFRKDFANSDPDDVAPDGSLVYHRELGATRASLVEIVLPPGQASRPIRHRTVEEIWFFLAGHGTISVKGAERQVAFGDTAVIPTGEPFWFRNDSETEPLRFLCYTSPPWPGPDEAILSPS